ncbi:hypothetical protein [Egbenema bharatensis]|uniref:hypothetical protein n=1 Tax=Egbenema bharatensis TaxID=3463334 RepID=UPI003A852021
MATCPCCSHPLLRHIRNHQVAYFCRHCWQDMPLCETPTPDPVLSPGLAGLYIHQRHTSLSCSSTKLMDSPFEQVKLSSDRLNRVRLADDELRHQRISSSESMIAYPSLHTERSLAASN